MKCLSIRIALFILLTSATFSVASAQDLLRWQFAEGDHYKVVMNVDRENFSSRDSEDRPEGATIYYDFLVTAVHEDGTATVELRIERLEGRDNKGEDYYVYDTDDESSFTGRVERRKDFFYAILNKPFVVRFNTQGELLELDLPQETEEALEEGPGPLDLQIFRSELFTGWPSMPEEAVAEGETWEVELASSLFDRVDYGMEFLHCGNTEYEDTPAIMMEVTYDMALSSEREDSTLVDTDSSGVLFFDNEAGRLLEFTTEATYAIEREDEFNDYSGTYFGVAWTVAPVEE